MKPEAFRGIPLGLPPAVVLKTNYRKIVSPTSFADLVTNFANFVAFDTLFCNKEIISTTSNLKPGLVVDK